MVADHGINNVIRQWAAEREITPEERETRRISEAWLADSPQIPGIPAQRARSGVGKWAPVEYQDPGFIAAMRTRLPNIDDELITAAAGWWQMVGDVSEAERWWDAGLSPLDQRALDYRAAGLTPDDLARRLGPMTVLQHLRRGSAPAWCVARLARQQRAS